MKNFLFLGALIWSSFTFGQQQSSQVSQQEEPKKLTQKSAPPKKRSTKKTIAKDIEIKNVKASSQVATKH